MSGTFWHRAKLKTKHTEHEQAYDSPNTSIANREGRSIARLRVFCSRYSRHNAVLIAFGRILRNWRGNDTESWTAIAWSLVQHHIGKLKCINRRGRRGDAARSCFIVWINSTNNKNPCVCSLEQVVFKAASQMSTQRFKFVPQVRPLRDGQRWVDSGTDRLKVRGARILSYFLQRWRDAKGKGRVQD